MNFILFIFATLAIGAPLHNHQNEKLSNILIKKRIHIQCPPEPFSNTNNFILSSKSDSYITNKLVYACHQAFLSKEFKFTNCILRVYASNFTNSNSDKSAIYFNSNSISKQLEGDIEINGCQFIKYHSKIGGSIYIFSSDPSKIISISNCYFDSNSTIQSEKGGAIFINAASVNIKTTQFINCHSENGGCIYYTSENNNQEVGTKFALKVTKCIFKNNIANSNGGCLYLTTQNSALASFIEVTKCKFTNNFAENGCDISYYSINKRSNEGEKLAITKNIFSRNSKLSIKMDTQESLIYVSFNQRSKIEFTNNRV